LQHIACDLCLHGIDVIRQRRRRHDAAEEDGGRE
jgi:hypothetical protein